MEVGASCLATGAELETVKPSWKSWVSRGSDKYCVGPSLATDWGEEQSKLAAGLRLRSDPTRPTEHDQNRGRDRN